MVISSTKPVRIVLRLGLSLLFFNVGFAQIPTTLPVVLESVAMETSASSSSDLVAAQIMGAKRSPVSSSFGYYIGGQKGTTFATSMSVLL